MEFYVDELYLYVFNSHQVLYFIPRLSCWDCWEKSSLDWLLALSELHCGRNQERYI